MDKGLLILVGSMDDVSFLLAAVACEIPSLPTTYLNLPLGASSKGKLIEDNFCLIVPYCGSFDLCLEKFCIVFFG